MFSSVTYFFKNNYKVFFIHVLYTCEIIFHKYSKK